MKYTQRYGLLEFIRCRILPYVASHSTTDGTKRQFVVLWHYELKPADKRLLVWKYERVLPGVMLRRGGGHGTARLYATSGPKR